MTTEKTPTLTLGGITEALRAAKLRIAREQSLVEILPYIDNRSLKAIGIHIVLNCGEERTVKYPFQSFDHLLHEVNAPLALASILARPNALGEETLSSLVLQQPTFFARALLDSDLAEGSRTLGKSITQKARKAVHDAIGNLQLIRFLETSPEAVARRFNERWMCLHNEIRAGLDSPLEAALFLISTKSKISRLPENSPARTNLEKLVTITPQHELTRSVMETESGKLPRILPRHFKNRLSRHRILKALTNCPSITSDVRSFRLAARKVRRLDRAARIVTQKLTEYFRF